jgi:hypothetical protein
VRHFDHYIDIQEDKRRETDVIATFAPRAAEGRHPGVPRSRTPDACQFGLIDITYVVECKRP